MDRSFGQRQRVRLVASGRMRSRHRARSACRPSFLVAHSALESAWGKSEMRAADGSPTYNLFGVKAGRSWQGASVELQTTEYVDGVAQTSREKFRVYGSYAEAFRDYANLLKTSPRFAPVLGQQDGTKVCRFAAAVGLCHRPGLCRQAHPHHQWTDLAPGAGWMSCGPKFSDTRRPLTATKERVRHEHRIHQHRYVRLQVAQLALATRVRTTSPTPIPPATTGRGWQASNSALLTGAGYVGQGASATTIERMYDKFLNNQVTSAQTQVSELGSYYSQVSKIDNMLADANSGLSSALKAFFAGVQDVATNPSQVSSRQSLVSR